MRKTLLIAGAVLAFFVGGYWYNDSRGYQGPPLFNYDGHQFQNLQSARVGFVADATGVSIRPAATTHFLLQGVTGGEGGSGTPKVPE